MKPSPLENKFVPKVYGFKVYGKKGSKYEEKKEKTEISYYTQEELKKLKSKNEKKKGDKRIG